MVVALAVDACGGTAVGDQNAASPIATVHSGSDSSVTYLKVSKPAEDDRLGIGDSLHGVTISLSNDGTTLAISAPYEDSATTGVNGNGTDWSAGDAGAVYVFVRRAGGWTQQAYIKASNTEAFDKFGFSIALSGDGNTLAVAATFEDSAARGVNGSQANNLAKESGAVYVFIRTGEMWSQQAYVKASNTDEGDQFGWSLALSDDGTMLAVGAPTEGSAATGVNGDHTDNTAPGSGAAYVFVRQATKWSQQAYLKASNAQAGDLFGFCLASSGDGSTLAICAYDEDGGSRGINGIQDNSATGSGAAYVFTRRGAAWSQDAYVKASNTKKEDKSGGDAFGSSIALSGDGNTLGIGAADEDGLSPGIDGDQSAPQNPEGAAGALFVFARIAGNWAQQAYVKPSNIQATDQFAVRLAFSHDGNVLVAGAPFQGGGGRGRDSDATDFSAPESGAVYVFTRTGEKWSQHAYIKAPNADDYDQFGGGVSLSADGKTLAVSASGEDGAAVTLGDHVTDNSVRDSGAVYTYGIID